MNCLFTRLIGRFLRVYTVFFDQILIQKLVPEVWKLNDVYNDQHFSNISVYQRVFNEIFKMIVLLKFLIFISLITIITKHLFLSLYQLVILIRILSRFLVNKFDLNQQSL
ncbi:conserved hypothetical domain protein [Mycoplasmoides gallisepticum str. F]|uniref:Uncharacterized protein n=1 Tax=Mycoplasmoides gallisepticum S6 TaxID=1006581 RepID=A0A0F6CLV0_MYCGL|nr:conserved hypothetical domain protein [Mycoplasmoides gallisepticum str. F]AHV85402.1 hypothetical protein GCW_90874 [Mycoplasmoides gallisepticum S6]